MDFPQAVISMWSPTLKCRILDLNNSSELEIEEGETLPSDDVLQLLQVTFLRIDFVVT